MFFFYYLDVYQEDSFFRVLFPLYIRNIACMPSLSYLPSKRYLASLSLPLPVGFVNSSLARILTRHGISFNEAT
jgi:hypothetical protein